MGIEMDKTAFEPRIGIAWKPGGSQNTAVRAGYAIFHDSSWNQGAQGLWQNPPYLAESDNFFFNPVVAIVRWAMPLRKHNGGNSNLISCGRTCKRFFPAITTPETPNVSRNATVAQNSNFKQGRVQQFNINVERQLPGNIVLTAGYAGSRSAHILVEA